MTERVYQFDLNAEVERLFDDSSVVGSGEPKAVILMGGVAAGKTMVRVKDYSRGYVLIDAAEIFHHLSRGDASLDFPGPLEESLEAIGRLATQRALSEQRNLVTEIIGDKEQHTQELIGPLKALGYRIEVVAVTCDVEEAWRRCENRGDNVSAFHAESFQRRWIIEACLELIQERDRRGMVAVSDYLKRFKPGSPAGGQAMQPLIFKDGAAALEYVCKYLQTGELVEGALLPALVLDAQKLFGTQDTVKVQEDGNQVAALHVASADGGFVILATTAGPKGPKLRPGQLVAWQAMKYLPDMAAQVQDKRLAWMGFIVGTLKPEHRSEAWVGDEQFRS